MKRIIDFEGYTASDILSWVTDEYGDRVTFACSFGAEDVVLLDMLSHIKPDIDIFYLDTDLHFKETYETIERLKKHYGRNFTQVKASLTLEEQANNYGPELWKKDPDLCCNLRKVVPLSQHLRNFDAWITGIRREQSPTRARAKKVELDQKFGLVKVNPLADWTHKEVWNYIYQHNVPTNPLHDQNFPSIGCAVCTQPVIAGQDLRSGRWGGFEKTECGLHK